MTSDMEQRTSAVEQAQAHLQYYQQHQEDTSQKVCFAADAVTAVD